MSDIVKICLGIAGGTVLATLGLMFYGLSLLPSQNFDYESANEQQRSDYLRSFGDMSALLVKAQFKGDVLTLDGVNTDDKQIYMNFHIEELLKGKDVPNSVLHTPEFAEIAEKQFKVGLLQSCKNANMSKFFEQNLSMVIYLQATGHNIADVELSKSACAEATG